MPGMELRDSRRLPGPNVVCRRPGAVIDVDLGEGDDPDRLADRWRTHARRILSAVGWGGEEACFRGFHNGASLAITAPIDALYAATEVNEWAFEAARAEVAGEPLPDPEEATERLRRAIAEERRPAWLAMREAAHRHGVAFVWDDDEISVGLGSGSLTWSANRVPEPGDVDWAAVHDVPVALVTGTNGKTTTVRLLAAMARAADLVPGISSTDGCWVAGEEVGEGDYSGPGGARLVTRDRRVEVALLETARGGMARRGLGLARADVAILTNIAEDHLGEWGVHDLEELLEVKYLVHQVADALVVNRDDPQLCRRHSHAGPATWWFSRRCDEREVERLVAAGSPVGVARDGELLLLRGERRDVVARLDEVPMTLGGAAGHNVENALGAICVATRLGLPLAAIREGLAGFDSSAAENPGRLNRFELGGVTAIVDFAHNPHGLEALLEMAQALPARRRLLLLGQAGDRDDASIRELARQVWRHRPERVIVKELATYLRGRREGEIPALLEAELRAGGAGDADIGHAPSEMAAVHQALAWAEPGDLLLLISHEARGELLELMRSLRERGWKPGEPV